MSPIVRPLIALFLSLAALPAGAGEYFRFDAHISPGGRAGSLHGYLFDEKNEELRVLDRGTIGPQGQTLGEAFFAIGAFAGCNGGVLRGTGEPVGLVIANGKKSGTFRPDGLTASGVLTVRDGHIALLKTSTVKEADLGGTTQVLQGGPLMVEGGKAAEGLDAKTYARRTVIITDGQLNWSILYIPSATLDGLARMLGDGKSFPKFKIATAMNLDGGLTSSLWVQRSENALPIYLKEVDPVRTAIAILPR